VRQASATVLACAIRSSPHFTLWMICSRVWRVRSMGESLAQSGRMRTLIHPGAISRSHVTFWSEPVCVTDHMGRSFLAGPRPSPATVCEPLLSGMYTDNHLALTNLQVEQFHYALQQRFERNFSCAHHSNNHACIEAPVVLIYNCFEHTCVFRHVKTEKRR